MSPFRLGYSRRTRRIAAFILAVALPLLAADANAHFDFLDYAPFGLYFVSVVTVAALGGMAPALLAAFVSMLCREYLHLKFRGHFSFGIWEFIGATVLTLAAVLISRLTEGRRRAGEELQQRTEALIESLHSGKCASWVVDVSREESPRWYSGSYPIFGRPFVELQGAPYQSLHPEDKETHMHFFNHMKTSTEPILHEFRVLWPDGETHWLETRGSLLPGSRSIWRGITVDITSRKLAEAALLRSEKLAAMGRLASTVAHEINNPLESVTNLLYLARTDPTLSELTQSYLATAEAELSRLGNITRLTLGFARTSEGARSIDLAETVDSVLAIFRPRCEMKSIQINRNFQPGIAVSLPPHELRQILTNLISNAIDALNGSHPQVTIHIRREQAVAILLIEDNGQGIDTAHLARIFDPFFTTKEDVGTGIGLWVTRELVHKNGGHILAESGDLPDGIKTRFRIEFPIATQSQVTAVN